MTDGLIVDIEDAPIVVTRESGDVIAEVEDAPLAVEAGVVGLPGVAGPQGAQGIQGPPGDGAADPGDLTLIFDNHLI